MKLFAVLLLLLGMFSLSLAEVVDSFKETCPQFFFRDSKNKPVVAPTVTRRPKHREICQFYKGEYRFATLYDSKFKIPVFSAYTYSFTESRDIKDDPWKIEPQLDDPNKGKDMKTEEEEKELCYRFQAQNKDYEKTSYTRGHVFPISYAQSDTQTESTFTLTNAAPQTEDNNRVWARQVEEPMRKKIKGNCDKNSPVYIVTGVVPGNTTWLSIQREVGGEKIDQGVNIPRYFWTAYSCKSKKKREINVSNAYIFDQITALPPENLTVDKLNKRLRDLYQDDQFRVFGKIKHKLDKGKIDDEL